jgi:conjugal transfer pilin signal peptidase TrbI
MKLISRPISRAWAFESLKYAWGRTAFLRQASPKDWLKSSIVIGVLFGAGAATSSYGLYIDTDEIRCLPEILYAASPRNEKEIKHGDVVSFMAGRDEMLGLFAGKRIAKVVMAMRGDHVRSDERGVFINGAFVAGSERSQISLENMKKKGVSPVTVDAVMKKNEIFVMGTMPRSFDSRYWGVMQESHIDKFVKPLI